LITEKQSVGSKLKMKMMFKVLFLFYMSFYLTYSVASKIERRFHYLGSFDSLQENGRMFYLSKNDKITWNGASEYCELNDLEFASLNTPSPSEILVKITNLYETVDGIGNTIHVNGKRDSQGYNFYWAVDRSSYLSNLRWGKGEPNNAGGNEDCLSIKRFSPGVWYSDEYGFNDVSCGTQGHVICEDIL
jgi:hypothetical protein